jgi:hypothetical protein
MYVCIFLEELRITTMMVKRMDGYEEEGWFAVWMVLNMVYWMEGPLCPSTRVRKRSWKKDEMKDSSSNNEERNNYY